MNSEIKQAYLQVSDDKPIQVVLRDNPEAGDGVPANLVELKGAVFDVAGLVARPDWEICGRIAELCRHGDNALGNHLPYYNAAVDKLEIALRIGLDLRKLVDPDEAINPETLEALVNGIIENVTNALNAVKHM